MYVSSVAILLQGLLRQRPRLSLLSDAPHDHGCDASRLGIGFVQQSLLRLFFNEDWLLQHRGMECAMGVVSGYRSFIDCWPCSDLRGHVASSVWVRSTDGDCNRQDTPSQDFPGHELLVPVEYFGFTCTKA